MKMIQKHANDLVVRHDFNQKLLAEHSVQLETEDHLYRLSGNTESSLRQEAREFEKEWTDVNRRVSSVEKELIRITRKLIEAKQMVQFDEDSLRKWEEMLTRKDEDNQLIENYMKQDTQKYKVYSDYGIWYKNKNASTIARVVCAPYIFRETLQETIHLR